MFGSKKEPKEKPKYSIRIGVGGSSSCYYDVFEYRIVNGIVEFRTTEGKVIITPGTPCMIRGGEWNSSSK